MQNRSGFTRTDAIAARDSQRRPLEGPEECHIARCTNHCFAGLPVCFICALMVGRFMRELLQTERQTSAEDSDLTDEEYWQLDEFVEEESGTLPPPLPTAYPESVVYYLMLSPVTVKIGTTTQLRQRITTLRTEAQYVVALEPGGYELERERHVQFKAERRNLRREDFELSDALKRHIDSLAPQRDEMLARALGLQVDTPRY